MQAQQTHLLINQRFRRSFAATLSVVYTALYVLAALCLGTGALHPAAEVNKRAADHGHAHHSHHHGPVGDEHDATPSPSPSDICDFAIQALTDPVYQNASQSLQVHVRVTIVGIAYDQIIPILQRSSTRSRAPPLHVSPLA